MSKAIISEQHLHDIADAIIAKGGATAPMTPAQMPAAIQSIPSGGGWDDEWQPPSDWPNIREILDNDTDTTYSNKYIFLVDVSLRNKAYGVGNYYWQGRKPSRLRFSDGRVISNPEWNYTFEFDISYGRYQWVIAENNADFIDMPGPGYYPYGFVGLLWIYGPDAVVTGYRANGKQSLQAIEVKTILNELTSDGGIVLNGTALVKVSCVEKLKVGYLKNGVKIGSAQVFDNCVSLRAVPDVLDLSACTNCSNMFANCYSLRAVPDVLDLSACTNCSNMFANCYSLRAVPDVLDLSACTNCSNMFDSCVSLRAVPDVLDLSACTNCSRMFANCYSLRAVPDVLDLSACTNCSGMFSDCYSLRAVPDVLDLSACTNCSNMFARCVSLRAVPDVLDLSACTNCSGMFSGCFKLQRIPTHVTVNISLQFTNGENDANYLTDPFETDSIAEFDAGGNIVGGFVYNLNVCPNNGQTIKFCNFWKSLFTDDQWTAIKTALAAKNWGCSPA